MWEQSEFDNIFEMLKRVQEGDGFSDLFNEVTCFLDKNKVDYEEENLNATLHNLDTNEVARLRDNIEKNQPHLVLSILALEGFKTQESKTNEDEETDAENIEKWTGEIHQEDEEGHACLGEFYIDKKTGKKTCAVCGYIDEGPPKKTESKTNEAEKTAPPVPQTMKPQEEPAINAEDHSMEDISKEEKEKKEKEKEKVAKEVGTKDMQKIEDKDLEQKQPKKESRQQLHLCNKCFKTFRSNESICTHCKSNEVEKIIVEKKAVESYDNPSGREEKLDSSNIEGVLGDDIFNGAARVKPFLKAVKKGDKERAKQLLRNTPLYPPGEVVTDKDLDYVIKTWNLDRILKLKEEKEETKVQESTYNVIFGDKHIETVKDAVSKVDAMNKAKVAYPVSRYNDKPIAITSVFKLEGEATKTGLITYTVTFDDGTSDKIQAKSPADVMDIVKAKNLKKNIVSTVPVEESKVNETVEELVGESDIDVDDQITLKWALEKDVIPKQWPAKEVMFDELAKAGEVGANVATEVDIYANYLKHVLFPRAKEAYSKQSVKEGVFDDVKKAAVETTSLEELEKALEVADEMIKQGTNKSAWETVRSILQKGIADKKKKSESKEVKEGEGSIVGSTKGVYKVEYTNTAGEKKETKLFAFDEADATTSVKKYSGVKEVISVKKIGEGKVPDPKNNETTTNKKLTEQPEKDGYTVVAKGLVDKTEADRIATEKKGMAVADADDPKKWQVIVKEA